MIPLSLVSYKELLIGDKVYLPQINMYGYIQQVNIEKNYGPLISIIWNDGSETLYAMQDQLHSVDYTGYNPRMS